VSRRHLPVSARLHGPIGSLVLWYSVYTGIGIIAGLIRLEMIHAMGIDHRFSGVLHGVSSVGAIVGGMLVLGIVSDQHQVYVDRIRAQERALRARLMDLAMENSERCRAEDELRTQRQQVLALIETSPVGAMVVGAGKTIRFMNTEAKRILGYPSEEEARLDWYV
jgi:PAS domain-containing protein